jgi:hypothetical protein
MSQAEEAAETLDPVSTRREVTEHITEQPGSACAGCHATLINPLGFALEGFDALGRLRDEEVIHGDDGEELGRAPVHTSSTPGVVSSDRREVDGAAGLMELMAESGKVEACMARQYFRFTFARMEDLTSDGCTLEALRTAFAETGSIAGMLREAAFTPEFRARSFREAR